MNALRSERGSMVLGGLAKLVLLFAVFGLIVYDGVAIGYAHFTAADHGALAADKAGDVWRDTNDIEQAYLAAQATLNGTGEKIIAKSFSIDQQDTVSFRLITHANTLLAQRIPFTKSLTKIEVQVVTTSAAPSY
jgi:hypothetical protein